MCTASSGSRAPSTTLSAGVAEGPPAAPTQRSGPKPNATASGMSAPSPVGDVRPS